MYIWRTDQVFLDGSNQVTVASTLEDSGGSTTIRLNKADSAEFVALASSLGLMKPGVGQPGTSGEAAAAVAGARAGGSARTRGPRGDPLVLPLRLALGAARACCVGLLAAVAVRGRRSAPAVPRRELIDGATLGFDGFDRAAGQGRT